MTEKKSKREKKFSLEELYQNKNFVPPKEKNLETIFEEPRESKDGMPILTSVRKYKRYLHFDPTEGKIQKRKMKAKKCIKKLKRNNSRTRSSTKSVRDVDISLYILETLGDLSDSDIDISHPDSAQTSDVQKKSVSRSLKKLSKKYVSRKKSDNVQSVQEVCEQNLNASKEEAADIQEAQDTILITESQQSTKTESPSEDSKEDSFPEKLQSSDEVPAQRSTCIVA